MNDPTRSEDLAQSRRFAPEVQRRDFLGLAALWSFLIAGVAMCLGMLGNVDDAEDIAQEAMLKGLLNINKLDKAEQFESWILQIARNLCIDFLRRRKRTKALGSKQPKPLMIRLP